MKRPLLLSLTLACALASPAAAEERRGDNPDAKPLTPQEQLARFKVPPGFEVQLVASEPEIHKPLNINFDAAGRIWTTGSELYPWAAAKDANGQPVPGFEKMYQEAANAFAGGNPPAAEAAGKDTVRVLSDFGPDGRARKIEVFADGLNIPTGIQPLSRRADAKGDSVIVYSIPNIWRFEDTDGDGKADKREPLYEGFGFVDTHGMSSNYIHWIDGWIYGCHGFRNHSVVKDRSGNVTEFQSGNTYRFRPDGSKIEYWSHGQTNPFGLTFDAHGNLYSADSHSKPVYMVLPGGFYEGIGKEHDGLGFAPRITDDDHGSSAIAGIAYISDERWPQEFQGNLFNGNPVTQRVNRASLKWSGSTPKATREADFLTCDDPWFRPVQVKLGPDGALYIADFYNPIIGHYEVPLTDPRRDRKHGRIWRVVWKGDAAASEARALPDLTQLDAGALVRQLGAPNVELQRLATNELVARLENSVQVRKSPLGEALSAAWNNGNPIERKNALWAVSRLENREAAGAINAHDLAVELRSSDPLLQAQIIRYLTEQESIGGEVAERLSGAMEAAAKGDPHVERAWCRFVAEHPTQAGFSSLLRAAEAGAGNGEDKELIYARRVALRDVLKSPQGFEWAAQLEPSAKAAEIIADVAIAVPSPAAAEFLVAHLQRTNFSNGRAGNQLKHVAMQAAPERLPQIVELLEKATDAHAARLAFADGLFDATRKRGLKLPEATSGWVQSTLLEALGSKDEGTIKRALQAVRDAKTERKLEPLSAIVRDAQRAEPLRIAALEALGNLPSATSVLVSALADPATALRKRAADLLGQQMTTATAEKMIAALATAPRELATAIASALAKSDAGAEPLLAAIESGRASAALLRNQSVSGAFAGRPQAMKDRAATLTTDLPPEDERLDKVIAQRLEAYAKAQPNRGHGAELFQQQCAACHKVKNVGGSIGPNLDGVSARGVHRLIEDILDPNRNVDPAFRQTIIETTDGRTLSGVNLRAQGELLVLNDVEGKEISVARNQVKTQTGSKLSLMPAIFEQALTEQQLADVISYLISETDAPAQAPQ